MGVSTYIILREAHVVNVGKIGQENSDCSYAFRIDNAGIPDGKGPKALSSAYVTF
jgi:hypothetical protein